MELQGNTLSDVSRYLKTNLELVWEAGEARVITNVLLQEVLGYSLAQVLSRSDEMIEERYINQLQRMLKRLKKQEPLQYVLGYTDFYGLRIKVNASVLIPRPETEELVAMIDKEIKPQSRIIDLCTGSGCIALALAQNSKAEVWAVDVSQEALDIAKFNAQTLHLNIKFLLQDILQKKWELSQKFDIIVSNPPYIKMTEKALMRDNVLKYEPHLALFVEDNDALVFYRRIFEIAQTALAEDGKIFFEINEALGEEMLGLAKEKGFEAKLLNDMYGRARFVIATQIK